MKNSKHLAKGLNDLLENYSVLYLNTRGYHWNIKGDKFFELHLNGYKLLWKLLRHLKFLLGNSVKYFVYLLK